MNMYMYISADGVDVTIGSSGRRPKIKTCEKFHYSVATYINNVVTNREEFSRIMTEIHDKYKKYADNVHLVISGTQILTKMLILPIVNEKTMISMAKKEMSNINNYKDDMIFDYCTIKMSDGGKKQTVLFAAISREFYYGIVQELKQYGFRVRGLNITEEVLVRLGRRMDNISSEPSIMCVLDGKNLIMCYYLHGNPEYTSRLRLIAERDTEQLFEEITKQSRAVFNYAKTKYPSEVAVNNMYVCGVHEGWKEKGIAILNDSLPFHCQVLEDQHRLNVKSDMGDNLISDHTYTVGNIF